MTEVHTASNTLKPTLWLAGDFFIEKVKSEHHALSGVHGDQGFIVVQLEVNPDLVPTHFSGQET